MKRQCAWCDKDMGEKPPYDDHGVTHGICLECVALEELKQLVDIRNKAEAEARWEIRKAGRTADNVEDYWKHQNSGAE